MLAWLGILIAVDRMAPGVLPPPATAAARRTAPAERRRLWHVCATHRNIFDGRCGPGCRMLCGVPWRAPVGERIGRRADPDNCGLRRSQRADAMTSTDLLGELGLHDADHEAVAAGIPPRRDRRHKHGPPYTNDLIIARLHQWAALYGGPPTKTDLDGPKLRSLADRAGTKAREAMERVTRFERGDWPGEATIRERFGSVNDALELAGYPRVPPGRPRRAMPSALPQAGESALRGYFRDVAHARAAGDALRLKAALLTLAMSALREAERLDGGR